MAAFTKEMLKNGIKTAIEFSDAFHGDEMRHFVDISPDGELEARSFKACEKQEMRNWLEKRQGKTGLYFSVNPLKSNVLHKKAKKSDVACVRYLQVDVDINSEESLARIRNYHLPPTCIVFSGGGFHAYWALLHPITDFDKAENCNRALASDLGGDNCHNVDRILRLPGTVNVLNAKKAEKGRVPVMAELVETDWTRVYDISQFREEQADSTGGSPALPVVAVMLEELPEDISPRIREVIELGDDPKRPRDSQNPHYRSRSEAVIGAACGLARAGCSEQFIAGILINPAYLISQSVLEKGRMSQVYALRQAQRAIEIIGKDWPDKRDSGPRATLRNTILAVQRLGLTCAHDLFRHRKFISGEALEHLQGELSDNACLKVRGLVIEKFKFDPRPENVRDAIDLLCLENSFHPIKQMLDGLVWDGVPRIDRWMINYLGAEDTALNCAISRITLIAAVRRVRSPGVKFDQIIVWEGDQGSGKSKALRILAGEEFYSDQEILTQDTKTQMELLEGMWIFEICELEGLGKAGINKTKAFASRQVDRSRMSYGRFVEARPRQAIFIGTTNDSKYLRDLTGNRRFWPVRTGEIDEMALTRDRDQLWAEAAYSEKRGESIVLPAELWAVAAAEQDDRLETDPWEDVFAEVNGKAYGNVVRVSASYLLTEVLHKPTDQQGAHDYKRVAAIMRKLGWKSKKYKDFRGYERPKPAGHKDDETPYRRTVEKLDDPSA